MTKELKKSKADSLVAETIVALVTSPTRKQAAEKLQISEDALYWRMTNYPVIREEVDKMPQEALARLKQGSVMAADVLVEGLTEKDPALKYENANSILEKVGISGKTAGVALQVNSIGGEMGIVVKEFKEGE